MNESEQPQMPAAHFLIIGGSGSGKSAMAERLAVRLADAGKTRLPLYYLATLQVGHDPENRQRVQRHRLQRQGLGFQTREVPLGLGDALAQGLIPAAESVVLLEDLSNLLANEMFLPAGAGLAAAGDRLSADLALLFSRVRHVVVVSNDLFADAMHDDAWTSQYKAALGSLNRLTASRAGSVVEAVCGLPMIYRDQTGKIGEWLCSGSLKN